MRQVKLKHPDERGLAMPMVIIAIMLVFLFGAILTARSVADQNQVSGLRLWEQALHAADAAVDHALFRLTEDRAYTTGETLPTFADDAAERAWVFEQVADNPAKRTREGEWALVKPSNDNVIFGVGWTPSKAKATKRRLVRIEYDFAPFIPTTAILTDGDLKFSGNPDVLGANGSAHANGNVTVSGNPNFSGHLSASGTYTNTGSPTFGDPANTGGGRPRIEVPRIDPRENYAMSQYDLCPNGEVRAGPAYPGPEAPNASNLPCQGALLDVATSSEYRGWKMPGDAKWDYGADTSYDGVYYLYQGSAKVAGNPGSDANPWRVTIFAEPGVTGDEWQHCPHSRGDIQVSGNPRIKPHLSAHPLLLIAGRDLEVSGNPSGSSESYEGVLAAHEQFKVNGNPNFRGTLIANDRCNTDGSPVDQSTVHFSGNPTLTYNGGEEVPLGGTVRITHWLEL